MDGARKSFSIVWYNMPPLGTLTAVVCPPKRPTRATKVPRISSRFRILMRIRNRNGYIRFRYRATENLPEMICHADGAPCSSCKLRAGGRMTLFSLVTAERIALREPPRQTIRHSHQRREKAARITMVVRLVFQPGAGPLEHVVHRPTRSRQSPRFPPRRGKKAFAQPRASSA